MRDLSKIKFWLFDLDNTLYSGDTKVFDQVDKKMSKFISEKLNVSLNKQHNWQEIFEFFNETMTLFETFFYEYQDYINDLETNV